MSVPPLHAPDVEVAIPYRTDSLVFSAWIHVQFVPETISLFVKNAELISTRWKIKKKSNASFAIKVVHPVKTGRLTALNVLQGIMEVEHVFLIVFLHV